jgi:hypothetical protein
MQLLDDQVGRSQYAGGIAGRFAWDNGLYDIERSGIGQMIAAVYNQAVYLRGTEQQALNDVTEWLNDSGKALSAYRRSVADSTSSSRGMVTVSFLMSKAGWDAATVPARDTIPPHVVRSEAPSQSRKDFRHYQQYPITCLSPEIC